VFRSIQDWYAAQCDGDWEHEFGVKIATLDNPGWSVSIDLAGTALENAEFTEISNLAPQVDWINSKVQGRKFEGRCGPGMLEAVISSFLAWANDVSGPGLRR
jgi:hypothetical protein